MRVLNKNCKPRQNASFDEGCAGGVSLQGIFLFLTLLAATAITLIIILVELLVLCGIAKTADIAANKA